VVVADEQDVLVFPARVGTAGNRVDVVDAADETLVVVDDIATGRDHRQHDRDDEPARRDLASTSPPALVGRQDPSG
jgi:hypothetical protein